MALRKKRIQKGFVIPAEAGVESFDSDRGRESVLLPLPPNRTGVFPAYGSPVGGFTWLRIDRP